MRASEHQHNTPEQVCEYLANALAAVETVGVPKELREMAFAKAVDLFAAKQVFFEQVNAAPILRPH